MKNILDPKIYYRFVSPRGVESDLFDKETAEKILAAGKFVKKCAINWRGFGPSSYADYRTRKYNIAKILRVSFMQIVETEEINELS